MIDKRVIERQIRKGKLDAAAHQRTLAALPDVSDRVAKDTDIEPSRSAPSVVSAARVVASPEPSAAEEPADDSEDDLDEDEDDLDEDEPASPDATAP